MHWLQTLDLGLFRFINGTLSNPAFDALMPFASGKGSFPLFVLAIAIAAFFVIWKGGARGRVCAAMLALILWPGDALVCNTIKHAVGRPRPFEALTEVRLPAGNAPDAMMPAEIRGVPERRHTSMPSSHAANWFAGTMVLFVFYRRSARFMIPMACLVSFSRVYNGVHYPSDVLAGAILGAGYAVAALLALNAVWQRAGKCWFPLWWERLPSLLNPELAHSEPMAADLPGSPPVAHNAKLDAHWLRLGYLLIGVLLLVRWAYLAGGTIELSEDEAYQWLWSKHLALSYYSKPPLIACTQFLGTAIWGDTAFGVRFFSPLIATAVGILLLRFFAREIGARVGFFLVLIINAIPLMALGATLMTVDPLSVLFWTAAMLAGWRAVREDSTTVSWLWVGLWMGLGFLSKYTALFQWLCWAVFFLLWPPARRQLRKPGPYLALLVNGVCALPVLVWNYQHQWVTVAHVAGDAGAGKPWAFTFRHFLDFIEQESLLLNPVFFIASLWACAAFWRHHRNDKRLVYCFSMGAPLFVSYLLFTFHSRVLPNWIAPAVLPMVCVMAIYWDLRWREGVRQVKPWLIAGLVLGLVAVTVSHDTNLIGRIAGRPLPSKMDPLTRVRVYSDMARVVGEARTQLLAEGKPVFIIGNHYGITSLVAFYLPEARAAAETDPLAYCRASDVPENQFYFWPGYLGRREGQNAIFVRAVSEPPLVRGWFFKWLAGETNLSQYEVSDEPAPAWVLRQFDSVTNLGVRKILYRGRVFHNIQIFECRDLR